jgi:hypothetical protein
MKNSNRSVQDLLFYDIESSKGKAGAVGTGKSWEMSRKAKSSKAK